MEWSQNHKVSKEEVIAKLKDDGDFDRLRRKIIQKLKKQRPVSEEKLLDLQEELRENIISIVKQSEALNRPGAENMKPRQLSDDIYQEVGGKVMSQISDGLWGIIRSSDDGMKRSYDRAPGRDTPQLQDKMDTEDVDHVVAPRFSADAEHKQACESDEDPDVPPGFG
ncbi:hypothetical protein M0R45_024564 [Rubus argutus]|uniref:BOD1/SHG1 domain-containing protein n=1 Tax=Rubus argutus TaxID=59490 RepID=A0AAW1WTG5_RUBAR